MLSPFERGLIAHLIADWLLQNEWLAVNKMHLRHPAAWIHAAVHALLLGIALGWLSGIVLGGMHLLIDTRLPLAWWQRMIGQRRGGDIGQHIAIWSDQVLHLVCIAAWIVLWGVR